MAEIRYARVGNVFPSFSRGGQRCLRIGERDVFSGTEDRPNRRHNAHAPRFSPAEPIVQLVDPGKLQWRGAYVFIVQLSEDLIERWPKQKVRFYVVAMANEVVESYLKKRFANIAKRNMGLARHALGVAMSQISTRPPAREGRLGVRAARIAKNFINIRVSSAGGSYVIAISDNLSYAMDAVQGGRAGVDDALKRAANRIAGMIRYKAGARLDEDLPTPFPEVKRK